MIKKHYLLINGSNDFNILEFKFIATLIKEIKVEDTELHEQCFSVKELEESLNTKLNYARLDDFTSSLVSKFVIIPLKDEFIGMEYNKENKKNFEKIPWFASLKYINGKIYAKLNEELKPYLTQLNKDFIYYAYPHLVNAKSIYSCQIYELLQRVKHEKIYEVNSLQNILNVPDSYRPFGKFKQKILDYAIEDLGAHSNISFQWTPYQKEGKKIKSIKMRIVQSNKVIEHQSSFC